MIVPLLVAQAAPPGPPGIIGWASYAVGLVVALLALRYMPQNNAKTVGDALGGLADRLTAENTRLVTALEAERAAHDVTRGLLAAMRQERDDLLAEQ